MKETLKLALEALKINLVFLRNVKPFKGQEDLASDCVAMTEETISSLEEALAKQEQGEPVDEQAAFESWLDRVSPSGDVESVHRQWEASSDYADLYTTPQQRKPLTDEQIETIRQQPQHHKGEFDYEFDELSFARAIEAAHGIKE